MGKFVGGFFRGMGWEVGWAVMLGEGVCCTDSYLFAFRFMPTVDRRTIRSAGLFYFLLTCCF